MRADTDLPPPDERTQWAIHIAELWAAGKMIGGNEDEVRNLLLAEVVRLRAYAAQAVAAERERIAAKLERSASLLSGPNESDGEYSLLMRCAEAIRKGD